MGKIGCIADDFTGATDIALMFAKAGLRTVQVNRLDKAIDTSSYDALVVALKSRSIDLTDAVAMSLEALTWLKRHEAATIYFKYCSTFDSTSQGNIGPVADALLNALEAPIAVVCPSFPANGRTVYMGHLFVGTQLLSDSSMRNHPVNPMRDSNLVSLMGAQSVHPVSLVDHTVVRQGSVAVAESLRALVRSRHRYAVTDAIDDTDLETVAEALDEAVLITGGSALAEPLARRRFPEARNNSSYSVAGVTGKAVVIAGSCSAATLRQVEQFKKHYDTIKVDVAALCRDPDQEVKRLKCWVRDYLGEHPILVHSSADADERRQIAEQVEVGDLSTRVEALLAAVAKEAVEAGANALVVAGGETSSAAMRTLGAEAFTIGAEISPGVPWVYPLGRDGLAFALKSGNFGDDDFFTHALNILADGRS